MSDLQDRLQDALRSAYTIEGELGGGGMSRVFVALETALDRRIVVKVLAPELAAGVSMDRFRREIHLAASLQHPHIVPLLHAGQIDDLLYYTMPLIEGESLRATLRRSGRFGTAGAVGILRDVADALVYAHERGVLHRDIKPDNVLLSGRHALVTDFGVARALGTATPGPPALTSAGIALGTPAYMAPEQATADTSADHRVDLYALGVTAYEILTGTPPFQGRTAQEVIVAHLAAVPTPITAKRPDLPAPLASLVMRCLQKQPSDRPSSAREVLAELEALATPPGALAALRPRPWRGAWFRMAAAGLTFVALAVIGYFVMPRGLRATLMTLLQRPAAKLEPRRIVVAPFDNETGDSSLAMLGSMAADWITQGLMRTGVADVVDARTALLTSRVVERTPALLRRANRARALAEETGAAIVVSGSYYRVRDSVYVQGEITDVATGRLLRAVEPVSGSAGAPTVLVEQLRKRAMAALALVVDTMYGKWSGSFATPPSFEAFQETVRGFESFYRGDSADSFRRLRHAATVDTGYLTPVLTMAYFRSYYGDWAIADSLTRRTARYADQLPPSERALLDVMDASLRGDLPGRLRAAWRLLELTPGSAEVPTLAAATAVYLNRPREALAALGHADPERGLLLVNPTYWIWLTAAYHELGDFNAEHRAARRAERQFPDNAELLAYEVRALAALGAVREVRARLEHLPALAERERALVAGRLGLVALRELRTHGHAPAPEVARVLAAAAAALASDTSADALGARGVWLYELGEWRDAEAIFRRLAATDTTDPDLPGYLGVLAARRGDRRGADALAARLIRMPQRYLFGVTAYWRARIAAVWGDREAAVGLLRQAQDQGHRGWFDGHPLHEARDFEALRGYPPFEELLRPKG